MKRNITYFFIALSACLFCGFEANAETFVINNENFSTYFGEDGYLKESVPAGSTLDFQGTFQGDKYSLFINKKVDVISSTEDAFFDSNSTKEEKKWLKFNVVAGADSTNITGLEFLNCDLFVTGASNVTIDDIKMVSNIGGVGQGTGFLAIHTGADSVVVKNSYFENGGTGSSILVVGKGGKKAVFDNNTFKITGSSGNIMSANLFVGSGENPSHITYTNNVIDSETGSSGFMYGITVCGEGNLVEGNTVNMKGNAITNQYGAVATKNIYRNNVITGGGTMTVGTYCTVEGNTVNSAMTLPEGTIATGNTFNADVTVSGKTAQLTDNIINGKLTLNSDSNTVKANTITSTEEYAVYMGSKVGNKVTDNALFGAEKTGDASVNYTGADATANVIERNGTTTEVSQVAADDDLSISSQNGTVRVSGIADVAVCNLYSVGGAHLASVKASQGTVYFEVPAKGVYLVEVVTGSNKTVTKIVADK